MKYKILELLKERKSFVSDEEISKTFNISQNTIHKDISSLKKEGYSIDFDEYNGYFLRYDDDIINLFEIKNDLNTDFIGSEFFLYDEVNSTNDEAKIHTECSNGTVFISEIQKKGKGRLGRTWCSSGKDLLFSILLKPNITPMDAAQITLVAGISICNAIRNTTGLPAMIKWPNDIIINNKKVVGILTEMSAEFEEIKYIIVGIGINVNSKEFPPDIINNTTSICIQLNNQIKRTKLLKSVLYEFEKDYKKYLENGFFKSFSELYKGLCLNIGKKVKIVFKDKEISGIAYDISENGELVVKDKYGNKIKAIAGEVSIRNEDGRYI